MTIVCKISKNRFSKTILWNNAGTFVGMVTACLILLIHIVPAQAQMGPHRGLRGLQESFRSISRSVTPAVVNVSAVRIIQARQMDPGLDPFSHMHPFFRQFFGDDMFGPFLEFRNRPRNYRQHGLGSGFIFDPRGYILTNRHVVDGADEVTVTIEGKKKYSAKLVGWDPKSDVAVIKIQGGRFPHAKLGDSNTLQVGDWVLAIGNPFGIGKTVTQGIVSAKGPIDVKKIDVDEIIQTDAAINPGNSGGPLVNIDGRVIGMNAAIFSRSGGYMGIGFAIPINIVRKVANAIMSGKHQEPVRNRRLRPVPRQQVEPPIDMEDHYRRFRPRGRQQRQGV